MVIRRVSWSTDQTKFAKYANFGFIISKLSRSKAFAFIALVDLYMTVLSISTISRSVALSELIYANHCIWFTDNYLLKFAWLRDQQNQQDNTLNLECFNYLVPYSIQAQNQHQNNISLSKFRTSSAKSSARLSISRWSGLRFILQCVDFISPSNHAHKSNKSLSQTR